MTCSKLATSIYLSASLLSSLGFANTIHKDKDVSVIPFNTQWAGFYAGINIGSVWHTMSITDTNASTFNATIQQVTNPNFSGGFQLGYRQQLNPAPISAVYGVEVSSNFAGAKSNKMYGSAFSLYLLNSSHELKNLTLAQALVGIAADRAMFFLSAGLSWSEISGSVVNQDGLPFMTRFSVAQNEFSAALGGGAEYAVNDHIFARFKVDVVLPKTYSSLDNASNQYDMTNHIIQGTVGINYRFG